MSIVGVMQTRTTAYQRSRSLQPDQGGPSYMYYFIDAPAYRVVSISMKVGRSEADPVTAHSLGLHYCSWCWCSFSPGS